MKSAISYFNITQDQIHFWKNNIKNVCTNRQFCKEFTKELDFYSKTFTDV